MCSEIFPHKGTSWQLPTVSAFSCFSFLESQQKKHMGLLHWVMFVLEIPNGLAETSPLTSFLRLASSPFPFQLMLPINTFILSTLSLSICFLIKQTVGQGECTLSPERHWKSHSNGWWCRILSEWRKAIIGKANIKYHPESIPFPSIYKDNTSMSQVYNKYKKWK